MTTGALLRLLQVTDSSFPTGGFAFSHGVEWLTQRAAAGTEARLGALIEGYVDQSLGRQALPAALAARRATSIAALRRTDDRLDASYAAEGEREAGRTMGERLLTGAHEAFGAGPLAGPLLAQVRGGTTPGQYAVAFGAITADQSVAEDAMLSALAFSMVLSVTQAAVRLNVIGQRAAIRLTARATPEVERVVTRVLTSQPHAAFGAFTPGLDVAGILHPTLPFRLFAS